MSIFVGGSIAAAVVFLLKESHCFSSFVSAYIIGGGIVVMLWMFLGLFVRRERLQRYILYGRQRQLEERLNFYAGRFIHELDEKNRKNKWSGEYAHFPPHEKGLLAYLDCKYVHLSTKGWDFMTWAVRIAMVIWAAVVALEFAQSWSGISALKHSGMWHDWRPVGVGLLIVALVAFVIAWWCVGLPSCSIELPSCSIERQNKSVCQRLRCLKSLKFWS